MSRTKVEMYNDQNVQIIQWTGLWHYLVRVYPINHHGYSDDCGLSYFI